METNCKSEGVILQAYIELMEEGRTPSIGNIKSRAEYIIEVEALDIVYGEELFLKMTESNIQQYLVKNKHYHYYYAEHYDCQGILFTGWFDFQRLLT